MWKKKSTRHNKIEICTQKTKKPHILSSTSYNVHPREFSTQITFFKNCTSFLKEQLQEMLAKRNPKGMRSSIIVDYILTSIQNSTILFACLHNTTKNAITTISNIFRNALWLEREIFEFFKVFIINHFDLRRLLLNYGGDLANRRMNTIMLSYQAILTNDNNNNLLVSGFEWMCPALHPGRCSLFVVFVIGSVIHIALTIHRLRPECKICKKKNVFDHQAAELLCFNTKCLIGTTIEEHTDKLMKMENRKIYTDTYKELYQHCSELSNEWKVINNEGPTQEL